MRGHLRESGSATQRKILARSRMLMAELAFCLRDMEEQQVKMDRLRRQARKLLRRFPRT